MVVQSGSEEEATPARRSENSRYVFVKNHVRQVTISTKPTCSPKSTCADDDTPIPHKRARTELCSSGPDTRQHTDTEVAEDLATLRDAYVQCRNLLNYIETKYGERLGLRDDSERANTHIVFDDEGHRRVAEQVGPLPECSAELAALLRSPMLPAQARHAVTQRLRAARGARADELRYHRAALLQHVRACPQEALAFVGSNLHMLPGYAPPPPPP